MRIAVFGRSDEDIRNTCRQAVFSPSCWIVLIMYGYGQCSFSGGNYPEMPFTGATKETTPRNARSCLMELIGIEEPNRGATLCHFFANLSTGSI